MFDLEQQIKAWRADFARRKIAHPEVLDELENHLREDIEQRIRAGADAQTAFEAAVRRIGEAAALKVEFAKTGRGTVAWLWRMKMALRTFFVGQHADALPALSDFTGGAQQTLALAREEAPRLHHDFIGTEHVLLGLTRSGSGVVPKIMQRLGVDSAGVEREIQKWVGLGQPAPRIPIEIPYTPRAKRALSLAAKEARAFKQSRIGAEHIFLGLLLEGHGVAALVLKSLGVDAERTRAEIRRELAG